MGFIERLFKVALGLVLIGLAVVLLFGTVWGIPVFFWDDFLVLVKGTVPVVIALVGVVFLMLSFEK